MPVNISQSVIPSEYRSERMPEKQFRADVIFAGKIEPSVQESFEKFHK